MVPLPCSVDLRCNCVHGDLKNTGPAICFFLNAELVLFYKQLETFQRHSLKPLGPLILCKLFHKSLFHCFSVCSRLVGLVLKRLEPCKHFVKSHGF